VLFEIRKGSLRPRKSVSSVRVLTARKPVGPAGSKCIDIVGDALCAGKVDIHNRHARSAAVLYRSGTPVTCGIAS
jgi:hypothetical protein